MKNFTWLLLIFFTLTLAVSCKRNTDGPNRVEFYEYLGGGEEVVLENEYLSLLFMPETAEIILTNKATGVEWRSNPPEFNSNDDFNTVKLMESQLALDYADISSSGLPLFSSLHSIERGTYQYKIVDNVLEVSYTIGNMARPFRIPPALPEDRMAMYADRMDYGDWLFLETGYRLYDINNLRSNDDKNQLLADYPDLNIMKLWVLRSNIPDYMKEEFEDLFRDAGYTYEDYYADTERYEVQNQNVDPAYSITMRYILDGKSLVVDVPFDRVGYHSIFPITQLTILPFFGAGGLDDEGYMLVPDGSGALINFNNGKNNQETFGIRVYGWDEAMPREAVLTDDKAPFPAFGIHKNGSSLFCVIEEGASYARIRADVSGRNCSWNRVYPVFNMINGAIMDIAERNQREIYQYEPSLPVGENITLRYTLCDEPGYVGMAKEYRSWLLNKYPNLGKAADSSVPIAVELVGAVNKTQHRFGLPFDLPLKLTSYNEMTEMINDFNSFGWKNVHIKLNGWFNRSVEHTVPTKISLIRALGNRNNFMNIIKTAEGHNFNVYPEVDFMFMRDVGLFSGFNLYSDAARYVNRERVQRYPYSFVWFGERKQWGKLNFLARPEVSMRLIDRFLPTAGKLGINNIAFKNMGSKLAGDYHERRRVSREASMKMRQDKFGQLNDAGYKIIVNVGFDYSISFASIVTEMILRDQDYGITDVAVPFYQIALHGLVPYTGKAINLAEDYTKNLLKTIESGAGLYFSFKTEDTAILQETKFRQFYANEYKDWIVDARKLYDQFTRDFGHLFNQAIVNHEILAPGLTVTVYEDGTRVIVNSSDDVCEYNGISIIPNSITESYIVLRQSLNRQSLYRQGE